MTGMFQLCVSLVNIKNFDKFIMNNFANKTNIIDQCLSLLIMPNNIN